MNIGRYIQKPVEQKHSMQWIKVGLASTLVIYGILTKQMNLKS